MSKPASKYRGRSHYRDLIKSKELLEALENHVFTSGGTMTQSQVHAATSLLRKTLPDLSHQEIQGEVEHRVTRIAIVTGSGSSVGLAPPTEGDIGSAQEIQRLVGASQTGKNIPRSS